MLTRIRMLGAAAVAAVCMAASAHAANVIDFGALGGSTSTPVPTAMSTVHATTTGSTVALAPQAGGFREPAMMMLFGTGLLAAFRARRRQA